MLNDAASGNEVGKPDVSELLVQTYGDQGITGFLKLTGAVTSAGSSDQLEFFEVGRRHKTYDYTSGASIVSNEINIPSANLTQGNGQGGEVPNDDTADFRLGAW